MGYDLQEKKSHFLLITVFISALAKISAHFSLEIYIFFTKDELGQFLPFLNLFDIKIKMKSSTYPRLDCLRELEEAMRMKIFILNH